MSRDTCFEIEFSSMGWLYRCAFIVVLVFATQVCQFPALTAQMAISANAGLESLLIVFNPELQGSP